MIPAAFFDIDGTLVGKNIVHHYIYIRQRLLPPRLRSLWTALFLAKAPAYFLLDKISRTALNVVFYRNYAGLPVDAVSRLVDDCFDHVIRPHIFLEVADCLATHRAAGRRLVLVTGSVDLIMRPLADALGVDTLIAPRLTHAEGRFTGELDGPPVGGAEKARRIRDYSQRNNIDLGASYAYGDSIADRAMLESVAHPHAVNPDQSLARLCRSRNWPALCWTIPR